MTEMETCEIIETPTPETPETKTYQRPPLPKVKYSWGAFAVMVLCVLFVFVPLYIMFITSIMTLTESQDAAFHWIPKLGITLDWYIEAFTQEIAGGINFAQAFANTMMMYLPSVLIGVLMSSMSAYAFAKIDFKLSKPMFAILLATMTLPNSLNTIVSFLIYDTIYWTDTPLPIMIPRMMGAIGIVFFLRQFYMGVPDDIIGAAQIDGLGEVGTFVRIMLPLSFPSMLAQFILTFIGAYNDYMGPLLYLPDPQLWTISVLTAFYGNNYVTQYWAQRMAGGVISMLPLVVLYFIAQSYILKGISITSGLKG